MKNILRLDEVYLVFSFKVILIIPIGEGVYISYINK